MGNKTFRKDGVIYDSRGAALMQMNSDNNKWYAVIVKCAHCGTGYFIPVIFPLYAKDIYTAVEMAKSMPRVKRDKKNVILDAFEIDFLENIFLEAINDRDPYIRGYRHKEHPELQARRILEQGFCERLLLDNADLSEKQLKEILHTADTYDESMVLQRYFAPVLSGRKVHYPTKVNKEQFLLDYFSQIILTQAIKKTNIAYMSMYYQIYGKNNPIGMTYDNGWFIFDNINGKKRSFVVDDIYIEKLKAAGVLKKDKQFDEEILKQEQDKQLTVDNNYSAIDRFYARLNKHKMLKEQENMGSQPGE